MRLIERKTSRGTFLAYWIDRLRPSPMGEIEALSRIFVNNNQYQLRSLTNSFYNISLRDQIYCNSKQDHISQIRRRRSLFSFSLGFLFPNLLKTAPLGKSGSRRPIKRRTFSRFSQILCSQLRGPGEFPYQLSFHSNSETVLLTSSTSLIHR